ncbi:hypothetical protein O181_016392 [Austropuccinia psidii MF-1]|uniref:Uncharacterized protein n=1 Tax=Austropuccinia psidii MF-1 TaxID=1389203 RepID=A0A9Q3C3X8_9BASI|nr:hypothetical protein [Austropuccinia psidii MF-1]
MSSSKPGRSRSGSFHDSDSESSIEYVETQSPMSPRIPLTTPIASSMNVSGRNIDVGNMTAQNSSTWSITNISITPIILNPTNTPMHVFEGPGSTPGISSKANPQSKFPCDFLLNPGWNPVCPRSPLGKVNSQPSIFHQDLRFMLAMRSGFMGAQKKTIEKCYLVWSFEGKSRIDTSSKYGTQRQVCRISGGNQRLMAGDELYASFPLVHKEKVTARQHPYASKPRTVQASSSREKSLDDEDENISPIHSETNDEPRRDDFMAHEEGTQSASESTHLQIPLAQSILEQSKVRQQRNQA